MQIKAGQIIVVTTGEYSDYCLRGTMRALVDFDAMTERDRFEAQANYDHWYQWGDQWLAWLIREGKAEPVDDEVVELWLNGYGGLSPEVMKRGKIEF